MNIVGVVPARGGSRRLPRKNLVPLMGRPLVGWTLEAARHSRHLGIGRVWVSTEDPEIAAEARARGANVVARPAELAGPDTWTEPVVQHAVEAIESAQGEAVDVVVWMNPSVPELQASDIDRAVEWRESRRLREVISVGDDGCTHSAVRVLTRDALFQRRLSVNAGVMQIPAVDIHTEDDLHAARRRLQRKFAWQAVDGGSEVPDDLDWELDASAWSDKAFMSEVDVGILERVLRRSCSAQPVRILEWGSGRGTLHFCRMLLADRCDFRWLSMEHDRSFVQAELVPHLDRLPDASVIDAREACADPQRLCRGGPKLQIVAFDAGTLRPFLARHRGDREAALDDYVSLPGRTGLRFDVVLVDGRKRRKCLIEASRLLAPGGVVLLHDAWRPYYRCAFDAFVCHRRFGDILWAGAHEASALEAAVGGFDVSPEWRP